MGTIAPDFQIACFFSACMGNKTPSEFRGDFSFQNIKHLECNK